MAAKKSRTARKTSKSAPEGVTVMLDTDTILTLNAAVEALSEFASAVIMASDDPAVRSVGEKTAEKGAKKSATKRERAHAELISGTGAPEPSPAAGRCVDTGDPRCREGLICRVDACR